MTVKYVAHARWACALSLLGHASHLHFGHHQASERRHPPATSSVVTAPHPEHSISSEASLSAIRQPPDGLVVLLGPRLPGESTLIVGPDKL